MKKRIAILLCTAVLALGLITAPALASVGPHYPIKVEEYTYGPLDEPRINKVYQLSLADDPAAIPQEDFERGGRRYYLLDMIKEDKIGVDTREYTETITMDSKTNDLSAILKQLDPHLEVTAEDSYTGLLSLDYTSVKAEAKGYQTSTKSLSATRTYANLSDADLSLVPKTVTEGGRPLSLGAVEWSGGESGFYTATATYTGTASSSYATGYTVTANYTGQVTKTGCEVVTYTAIFGSVELPAQEEPYAQPDQAGQEVPAAGSAGFGNCINWIPPVVGCVGGLTALAAAVVWVVQRVKERRGRV